MKILALEFSTPQRSVAVLDLTQQGAVRALAEVIETGARAAMRPLEWIGAALRQAGLEREQIEALAVGLGPGSYTGIRAAIALAQGWQLAAPRRAANDTRSGVKIHGISSIECLAATAQEAGLRGPVTVVVDAQRGEFYLAGFELESGGWRETEALRLAKAEEVRARAQAGTLLIGPEVERWFDGGRVLFPRAAVLGRMARECNAVERADALEPIYLRAARFVKAPPPRW